MPVSKKPVACLLLIVWATTAVAAPATSLSMPTKCLNTEEPSRLSVHLDQSSAAIPTPLLKPKPIIPLGCERPFLFKGELYPSDPPQLQDASNLRYFLRSVPEADEMMKKYQSNLTKTEITAYTGSFGLFLIIFSQLIARLINSRINAHKDPKDRHDYTDQVKGKLQLAGLVLAVGGVAYGVATLRNNDHLIENAVSTYNQAKPKSEAIELEFSTGWFF